MGKLTKFSECNFWPFRSRFQFNKERDSHSETRNVLLVVAGLIAAVTFQAGVNPPGGVWQDSEDEHTAGRAIYSSDTVSFYVFLISNTMALSSSILVILSLTYLFPFYIEIRVAIVSMIVTYGSAIFGVTPHESVKYRYILFAAAVPFLVRFMIEVQFKKQDPHAPATSGSYLMKSDDTFVIAVFYNGTWFKKDDGYWKFQNYNSKITYVNKMCTLIQLENEIYEILCIERNKYNLKMTFQYVQCSHPFEPQEIRRDKDVNNFLRQASNEVPINPLYVEVLPKDVVHVDGEKKYDAICFGWQKQSV